MTWLGYAETTGLAAIGYRITDEIADPPESLASETLLRLPQGFLSYQPPVEAPPVEAPPSIAGGYVTFGSFSNLGKVGPDVIGLWGRILAAVPGSRLLVKALSLADPETLAFTEERLLAHGIAPGRFDCAPGTNGLAEHLTAYHRVDIALDPFPYNGTTTTCEALWMGVPVVTLAGTRHAGRVGASLLTRLGMEDMIADSPETYRDKAVALARDPARLASLRAGMRDRIAASPLMDAGRFTRDLEQAYRWAWRRWCENPDAAIGK
jgi:protein O-GlcNAc transferase